MTDLYLASQSPRRRELLAQLGVNFDCLTLSVPEERAPDESPEAYVSRLALDKARSGWAHAREQGLAPAPVLGSDTIGVCLGKVLEKPLDRDHALTMWRLMSGRAHEVLTAVALCDGERERSALVRTRVFFRALDEAEMNAYWASGEPQDKAGGYGIQGLGGVFVERIEGSYSAVVGLPLAQTAELLNQFEIPWWGHRVDSHQTQRHQTSGADE
ncbi:Maf family protein [Marinimicrobium agarilyticum]|uniref:Maf family protein n=1 Tax=Marinimicrobium agarilyticum TaxID=306546 RepID=UPI00040A4BC2|nr:nucleoside triphosphate pyrophosphatase [Marinimicrobium agarilyticum]